MRNQYLGFLNSQSLWITKSFLGLATFNFEQCSANSSIPNDINIVIQDNEVLGKRIEHFFNHLILSKDRYRVIAKNIQVFQNKITIGEIDFLLQDNYKNQILHLELIYKFYLYDPEIPNELNRWIGPNRNDSLLQKINKLKKKQLPLLYKNETQPILENLKIVNKDIKQQVCFLANLFLPFSARNIKIPHLNTNCVVGYWIQSLEFFTQDHSTSLFHIPLKKDWVSNPKYCKEWNSIDTITKQVQTELSKKKSPLLWVKDNNDIHIQCFVVWW